MTWVYLDGALVPEAEARIGATSPGVLHGRGLFETFRVKTGGQPEQPAARLGIYRFAQHMDRLEAGARTLEISPPMTRGALEAAVYALVERCSLDDARVRLTLTAGAGDGPGQATSVLIQARAATDYPERLYEAGVSATLATVRRNETSCLSRIKSINCLDNILARDAARRIGAAEALLLNSHGLIAEGSATNVFVLRCGELVTPPVDDGALPGVTRAALLEMADEAGIRAQEASITQADLHDADEAFLTNAVAGVLPLVAIDGATVGEGKPGELTLRLRDLYVSARSR